MPDPRYHRQIILPQIGDSGQQRLAASRVLLVGSGALGCVIADLLTRAGVGHLTIVDRDIVERTNLQRQTLFDERDARDGATKAEAAAARLRRVNSAVTIDPVVADFASHNAERLFDGDPASKPADLLIDGADNFLTRYLLNDLAVKRSVPLIYGGAVATTGMTMTIIPGLTPCLRCLFPAPPTSPANAATCDTAGILAPVSTIIAATQALEAIKLLVGATDARSPDLLEIDPWHNRSRRLAVAAARSPACPCCAARSFEFLAGKHDSLVSVICTRNDGGAVQIQPPRHAEPRHADPLRADPLRPPSASAPTRTPRQHLDDLAKRLEPHGSFTTTDHALRGVLPLESGDGDFPIELTLFADGRAVIRGTSDPNLAKAIYARYIGE